MRDRDRGVCTNCHTKPIRARFARMCTGCERTAMLELLKGLEEVIGKKALNLLRSGKGILNVWRRSSPHNWWVSTNPDNNKYYWHSGERGDPCPTLTMFSLIKNSERAVSYGPHVPGGFRGSDEGMPEHSKFRLRKVFCK
jgi:hypothetical protein